MSNSVDGVDVIDRSENDSKAAEISNEVDTTSYSSNTELVASSSTKSSSHRDLDQPSSSDDEDDMHSRKRGGEDVDAINPENIRKRRKKVSEMSRSRKDDKLTTKINTETQFLKIAKDDLELKQKLLDNLQKSDETFHTALTGLNAVMLSLGNAVQQSVGILSNMMRPQHLGMETNGPRQMSHPRQFDSATMDSGHWSHAIQQQPDNIQSFSSQHNYQPTPNYLSHLLDNDTHDDNDEEEEQSYQNM